MVTNLKTQIVTNLKNSNCIKSSNCDETQIGMKLENGKSEKKFKMWRKKHKLKMWQNSNYDKTHYLDFEKT